MAKQAILFDSYDMALKTFWLEVANKMTFIHRTLLLYNLKFLVLLISTRSSSSMKGCMTLSLVNYCTIIFLFSCNNIPIL